jgi:hypothetical protein
VIRRVEHAGMICGAILRDSREPRGSLCGAVVRLRSAVVFHKPSHQRKHLLALRIARHDMAAALDPLEALGGAAQALVDQLGVAGIGGDDVIVPGVDQQGGGGDCGQVGDHFV